jgi:hypothetical protein
VLLGIPIEPARDVIDCLAFGSMFFISCYTVTWSNCGFLPENFVSNAAQGTLSTINLVATGALALYPSTIFSVVCQRLDPVAGTRSKASLTSLNAPNSRVKHGVKTSF